MEYAHYFIDNTLCLSIKGDLLGLTSEREIVQVVETYSLHGVRKVVLDLKFTNHVNSKGLNILIKVLTHLDDLHGDLLVINVSEQLKKLFKITKLDMVFKVAQHRTEALFILNNQD